MDENQPSSSTDIINNQEVDSEVTWKHPSHLFQRLLALFLMCLIGFGKYFYGVKR
jgi:hypothetical protein